jgi:hypothetical protein
MIQIILIVQIFAYGEFIDDREMVAEGHLNVSDCLYRVRKIRQSWENIEHADIIYIGCQQTGGES